MTPLEQAGLFIWIDGRHGSLLGSTKRIGAAMADELSVPSFISPATKQTLTLETKQGYGQHMVPEMMNYIAEVFAGQE